MAVALFVAVLVPARGYCQGRADELVKQGVNSLQQHKYELAIAQLSAALVLEPANADALSRRGEAYAYNGNLALALADCNQAVKLAPDSAKVFERRGIVYYASAANRQAAISDYDMAIKLDPSSARTYRYRGQAYLEEGQIDPAIADFDESLRLDPSEGSAYSLRGNARLRKGDYDRAWDDFNKAIEVDPKNAYAYFCRGAAAARRYAIDQAIDDYNEAIRLDPSYQAAYEYRGRAERYRNRIWWGEVSLTLGALSIGAILVAAIWCFFSPTAFGNTVELQFERKDDGSLVFYNGRKRIGYLVPDPHSEQTLRRFARRFQAAALASGVLMILLMFATAPLTVPLITWIQTRTKSPAAAIWAGSFSTVGILVGILFAIFFLWRRAAIHGLVKVEEKGKRRAWDRWFAGFVADMPMAVRWILLGLIVCLFVQSVAALWRSRNELWATSLANTSPVRGAFMATYLMGFFFWGWVLISALKLWRGPLLSKRKPS